MRFLGQVNAYKRRIIQQDGDCYMQPSGNYAGTCLGWQRQAPMLRPFKIAKFYTGAIDGGLCVLCVSDFSSIYRQVHIMELYLLSIFVKYSHLGCLQRVGVVTTVKFPTFPGATEPLQSWLAYHLNKGFAKLWVFVDDPTDTAVGELARV